jgi:Domain of unknown function (DUF1841)
MRYDPDAELDVEGWVELNEDERLSAVQKYHKRTKARSGNSRVHCTIHVAVETQLAEGHPEASEALARLLAEGLGRHEALHAIGSVLAQELFAVVRGKGGAHDPERYAQGLRSLTARSWRAGPA